MSCCCPWEALPMVPTPSTRSLTSATTLRALSCWVLISTTLPRSPKYRSCLSKRNQTKIKILLLCMISDSIWAMLLQMQQLHVSFRNNLVLSRSPTNFELATKYGDASSRSQFIVHGKHFVGDGCITLTKLMNKPKELQAI